MSLTVGCGEKLVFYRVPICTVCNGIGAIPRMESQAFSWGAAGRWLFPIWGCGIPLQVSFVSKLFELQNIYLKLFFWMKK